MEFFRRNPFFYTVLAALLGSCMAGIWYLAQLRARVDGLKRSYETKSAQYARYVAARPSPTKTNLKALEDNYATLYSDFEKTMAALDLNEYDREAFFGVTPDSRAAWSYEINKYLAGARSQAMSNGVRLLPGASFGFSDPSFVPRDEDAALVHRQIIVMTTLLEVLFDSGIDAFASARRGALPPPAPAANARAPRSSPRPFSEADEFIVPPDLSVAVPGIIDGYVFRLAFKGQSIALRSFVNRIATAPLPFAIRGIQVDLARESGLRADAGGMPVGSNPFVIDQPASAALSASNVPIISENSSLFVVTIEFLDLAVEIAPPAAATVEGEGSDA